jgi:uncharacterized membrane protein YcjF (UPF0283 family)
VNEILVEHRFKKRLTIVPWLLSIAFIAAGIYLTQIGFMQLEWLTRSGCVITLLGIWSSIGGILQERIIIGRLTMQHRIALSRAKIKLRKINAPKEYIDKEVESIEEQFEDSIDAVRDQFRLHLGIVEVSLLMVGTFIWGFGDLLFKFI